MRDVIGVFCWFFLSVVIGFPAFPIMVVREVYQWKRYKLKKFEWEDVIRYGIIIVLGSIGSLYLENILFGIRHVFHFT